jgi:hypothetical protein
VNRFALQRIDHVVDRGGEEPEHWDLCVPVIDDIPLHRRTRDRAPGTWTSLVAAPSRHWLGSPDTSSVDAGEGRAEVLTGTCGDAGCCGVFARIVLEPDTVRWEDFQGNGHPPVPEGLVFEFDRAEYEAAIEGLSARPAPDR